MLKRFAILLVSLGLFITNAVAEPPRARLRIGAILPLTGATADYGQSIQRSIELAQSDSPESFRDISFIYEDVAYDPKLAVAAFHKLTSVDHVDAVYVWGIGACKVVAPLAQARSVPMIGQCIDPGTGRDRPSVLRFMNYTDEYLQTTARYLDSVGAKRLAIILTENPYLEEMEAALERNLRPGQTTTVLQRYPEKEMDFRAIISRLRTGGYDAVGVFLSAGQIATFYKQAREQGLAMRTFGTNYFESASEIAASDFSMDHAVFANNLVNPAFIQRFRVLHGSVSQLAFGALAYEFASTVARIVSARSEVPSGSQLLEALTKLPRQEGVAAGPYEYVDSGKIAGRYFRFPIVMKEIEHDRLVALPEATTSPGS